MATQLYELIQQRARRLPESIAFGGQDDLIWRVITSRAALDLVDRLSLELAALGVVEGDRVVLWVPNHWRTPLYLFALWRLGAIPVPFDREMNPDAGKQILASIDPRLVIAGYNERPEWSRSHAVTEWWEPGTKGSKSPSGTWILPAEETAAVFFTSGTTGTPKGCVITHANLCSQVDALRYTIPLDGSCRMGSILPLSHLFELTVGLLYPFSSGAEIHYIPSRRGPDIVRVLSEQRITHMLVVPQLLALMGHALDDQLHSRLPSWLYRAMAASALRLPLGARRRIYFLAHHKIGGCLRMMASGGAGLPVETQMLWERLGVRIVQGYGVSECSPVIACGVGDGSTPPGSVGKPLRNVEVRFSPEGELLVRGPNVMRGYWKDPERTAEVLSDGWYSTGDLAHADGEGNITLAGRAKDLIVLPSGMKVWPQDVEDVLRSEPGVSDAAVIAVPGSGGGMGLHAYLVPATAGARESGLTALVSRCNGRLAVHQRLATASWWPESDFPRTAIGKVRRNLLPLPQSAGSVKLEATAAADDPTGQTIAGVARSLAVHDDQTLASLGMDSFGLVELALALEEKTGKAVGDGDLSIDMTVEQVRLMVAQLRDAGEGGESRNTSAAADQPHWPYSWGRIFRFLGLPFDAIYRFGITRTVILGEDCLKDLPDQTIFAGTHHSFADMPLVRQALLRTSARRLANRLVIAAAARGWSAAGPLATYCRLALGLYPLDQVSDRDVSLRGLVRAARAGNAILIFPQGMHAKPEREREGDPAVRFRPGVAHLAQALSAVVVPFGVAGTEQRMPPTIEGFRGRVVAGIPVSLDRGPLAIAFGEPLRLTPGEPPQDFAARLQQICYALTRDAEAALAKAESDKS